MPEIKAVRDVIASREMEFHHFDGRIEKALLKVGLPFECGDGCDWCCSYELSAGNRKKVFGIHGVDSLQALSLAMSAISAEIEYWERSQKGEFYFLGEEGSGL